MAQIIQFSALPIGMVLGTEDATPLAVLVWRPGRLQSAAR